MSNATITEAVGLLRRLRDRAATWSVKRPTIRGLGIRSSLKVKLVASHALRDTGYYGLTQRKEWLDAIDCAIATLEASDA